MLERAVRADGVPLHALHVLPDPADHAPWADLKTAASAGYAMAMEGLAGSLRSTVETITVGSARPLAASRQSPLDIVKRIRDDPTSSAVLMQKASVVKGTKHFVRSSESKAVSCPIADDTDLAFNTVPQ